MVQSKTHAIPALIKVLLKKPHLGRHIKKILCDASVETLFVANFTQDDFARCAEVLQKATNTGSSPEPMERLKLGEWNPWVALILCHAPYLEEIQLFGQGYEVSGFLFIDQVLAAAARLQESKASSELSLSSLRSASIYYYGDEFGHGIEAILPYISLNSMEKVSATQVMLDEGDEVDPGPTCHLKDLDLTGTLDGDKAIEYFRRFKSLEQFKYWHEGATVGDADFLPQRWGRAIAHLAPTLQKLVLDGEPDSNQDEQPDALGPLIKFQCLKELSTNCDILFGPNVDINGVQTVRLIDILPKSLERLCISLCGPQVVAQLTELLAKKEEHVPLLKEVVVQIHHVHSAQFGIEFALLAVCGAAGVALNYTNPSGWRHSVPEAVAGEVASGDSEDEDEDEDE